MAARITAALMALACVLALAWETRAKPRDRSPSKLEKSCHYEGNWLPCFIRDEALQQQWDA